MSVPNAALHADFLIYCEAYFLAIQQLLISVNLRFKDNVQPKKRAVKRGAKLFALTSYTTAYFFRY
jgi:hypothetical protein